MYVHNINTIAAHSPSVYSFENLALVNGRALSVQFNHINILCFNVEGVFMGWVDWIDNIFMKIFFVKFPLL
jgi:hypothetical protein